MKGAKWMVYGYLHNSCLLELFLNTVQANSRELWCYHSAMYLERYWVCITKISSHVLSLYNLILCTCNVRAISNEGILSPGMNFCRVNAYFLRQWLCTSKLQSLLMQTCSSMPVSICCNHNNDNLAIMFETRFTVPTNSSPKEPYVLGMSMNIVFGGI